MFETGLETNILVCGNCKGVFYAPTFFILRLKDGIQKTWRCPSCLYRNQGYKFNRDDKVYSWVCRECGAEREPPYLTRIEKSLRYMGKHGSRVYATVYKYGFKFPECSVCGSRNTPSTFHSSKRGYTLTKRKRKPHPFWDFDRSLSVAHLLFKEKQSVRNVVAMIYRVYKRKLTVSSFIYYYYRQLKQFYFSLKKYSSLQFSLLLHKCKYLLDYLRRECLRVKYGGYLTLGGVSIRI